MERRRSLPNADQLSIVSGAILMGYLLLPYLDIPLRQITIRLLNLDLVFELQISVLVSLLMAAMTAVGAAWLLQNHPRYETQPLYLHVVLPALSAWVLSIPLAQAPFTPRWWGIFLLAAVLLITVLTAEYVSLDVQDERHTFATMGLTALSFALYLFLAIATRGAGLRLYAVSSTLAIAIFPISLRTLYLRLAGEWHVAWALGIALVVGQLAAGLHYFPLSPILFGMLMLTFSFTLVNLAQAVIRRQPLKGVWIESAAVAVILLAAGISLNLLR
ncbi:MAG: hypothetical protein HPY85_10055 [Anaerolineae bacterium]|nr:hypothetical protein [Anaerolineae bacterium]